MGTQLTVQKDKSLVESLTLTFVSESLVPLKRGSIAIQAGKVSISRKCLLWLVCVHIELTSDFKKTDSILSFCFPWCTRPSSIPPDWPHGAGVLYCIGLEHIWKWKTKKQTTLFIFSLFLRLWLHFYLVNTRRNQNVIFGTLHSKRRLKLFCQLSCLNLPATATEVLNKWTSDKLDQPLLL